MAAGGNESKRQDEGLAPSAKVSTGRHLCHLRERVLSFFEPRISDECLTDAIADRPCSIFKRIPLRSTQKFFRWRKSRRKFCWSQTNRLFTSGNDFVF